ncbi:hypothetical protein FOZ63_029061, partial [Perkinsus olseni]
MIRSSPSLLLLGSALLALSSRSAATGVAKPELPDGVYKNRNQIVGIGNLTAVEFDKAAGARAKLKLCGSFFDHELMLMMSKYQTLERSSKLSKSSTGSLHDCFHFAVGDGDKRTQLNKVMKRMYKELSIPSDRGDIEARRKLRVCYVGGRWIAYFGRLRDTVTGEDTLAYPVELELFHSPLSQATQQGEEDGSVMLERILAPK